jgi:hypothetical protein
MGVFHCEGQDSSDGAGGPVTSSVIYLKARKLAGTKRCHDRVDPARAGNVVLDPGMGVAAGNAVVTSSATGESVIPSRGRRHDRARSGRLPFGET